MKDMNEILNGARLWRLMRKYVSDNRSTLVMTACFVLAMMVITGAVTGIVFSNVILNDYDYPGELGFMAVSFVLCGCLFASIVFKSMWSRKGALGVLMTPGSALEKMLVCWIVAVPGFIVWSLVCALTGDLVKVLVGNYIFNGQLGFAKWGELLCATSPTYGELLYTVLLIFVTVQSFYLLGSIVWRKHNFIKTFLVTGLVFMVYSTAMSIIVNVTRQGLDMYGREIDILRYGAFEALSVAAVLFNYALTWQRLRESEIIHRW